MTELTENAALIVIDVQKGFEDPYFGRRDNPAAEDNIVALIRAWRSAGRPIVLVRQDSAEGSPLAPTSPGNAIKDVVLAAFEGAEPDLFVTKNVNSAFYGTPDLDGWLRERGIGQLVIVGIQTNMCNETTARMGGNLGYDVLYPIDAMHTFDAVGPDGETVTAEELTRATAASLHHGRFARVLRTADVLGLSAGV
ncbi:cysteine hydrolase family protein [Actinoallomurus rhizosphaericola]|uniref:cysteine hydrolase family protein n=1 Tax=Actinoallomurus rhizosphaericola TaxID=2952536 RepID=UPI00209249AD|nr:cysteine hydrolase family protein [Actinoallomurus rhizosphaericola]MCO5998535.1 cysteine hydrolase [Actinoallomurus rhizosphaericola]